MEASMPPKLVVHSRGQLADGARVTEPSAAFSKHRGSGEAPTLDA